MVPSRGWWYPCISSFAYTLRDVVRFWFHSSQLGGHQTLPMSLATPWTRFQPYPNIFCFFPVSGISRAWEEPVVRGTCDYMCRGISEGVSHFAELFLSFCNFGRDFWSCDLCLFVLFSGVLQWTTFGRAGLFIRFCCLLSRFMDRFFFNAFSYPSTSRCYFRFSDPCLAIPAGAGTLCVRLPFTPSWNGLSTYCCGELDPSSLNRFVLVWLGSFSVFSVPFPETRFGTKSLLKWLGTLEYSSLSNLSGNHFHPWSSSPTSCKNWFISYAVVRCWWRRVCAFGVRMAARCRRVVWTFGKQYIYISKCLNSYLPTILFTFAPPLVFAFVLAEITWELEY